MANMNVNDVILMLHAPDFTPEFIAIHERIEKAMREGQLTDDILATCLDDECLICGFLLCPHHEALHFHHDGCPVCSFVGY